MAARDPEMDLRLFGSAYGETQPDGSIRWIDPKDMIIIRADRIGLRVDDDE